MSNAFTRRTVLRGFGALGLAGATSALLAACGGSAAPAATSGAVDIQFWTHDPGYIKTFQAAIADAAITGDIDFDYTITPTQASAADTLTRAISQASAGGDGPDMIGVVIDQFPRVMKNSIAGEMFVDLSDIASEYGDTLLKTAPYTVDGKLYGIESDLSVTVQYYRADVFETNGIDADGLTNWDDWLAAGAELNAKTGQFVGMHPNGDNGAMFNQFLQFLLQRGGSPFDEKGELTLESQEAIDTLTFLRKGIESKAFTQLADPYGSATAGALKDGSLAAIAMPNWYNAYGLQANVPDQAGLWRARSLPLFAEGGHAATTLGGTAFAIGKDTANSAASLELLKAVYLTPAGQLLRFTTAGYLPTLSDLYESEDFLSYEDAYLGNQKIFEIYAEGAKDLPTFYQNENAALLPDAAGQAILDVLNGTSEPEAALKKIVDNYTAAAQ